MPGNNRGFMQRMSVVSGVISILLAIVSGVFLYFRVDETGFNNPVAASLLACCFFFVFVATVLIIIGRSDIPSFRFDDS